MEANNIFFYQLQVPRVFINGTCVGGGDETVRLSASGELRKILST